AEVFSGNAPANGAAQNRPDGAPDNCSDDCRLCASTEDRPDAPNRARGGNRAKQTTDNAADKGPDQGASLGQLPRGIGLRLKGPRVDISNRNLRLLDFDPLRVDAGLEEIIACQVRFFLAIKHAHDIVTGSQSIEPSHVLPLSRLFRMRKSKIGA